MSSSLTSAVLGDVVITEVLVGPCARVEKSQVAGVGPGRAGRLWTTPNPSNPNGLAYCSLVGVGLPPPQIAIDLTIVRASMSTAVSKEKFEKAVEIVRSLPKSGPIQPTQDEQLYVGTLFFLRSAST
jgi:hypothetical protein